MYARNIFNEMKTQIAEINSLINIINDDVIAEKRNSQDENWTVCEAASVESLLPPASIAKVQRLAGLIGFSVSNMIMFLSVSHYDFKYFNTLIK